MGERINRFLHGESTAGLILGAATTLIGERAGQELRKVGIPLPGS